MGQIKKILGNNIRNLRISKGWTQGYLADVLELTPSFLTLVESGQRGMSLEVVENVSEIFEIPIASLFIDHDYTPNPKEDKQLLRNAELNHLKQKLSNDIQKTIETSITALMSQVNN